MVEMVNQVWARMYSIKSVCSDGDGKIKLKNCNVMLYALFYILVTVI